MLVMTKPLDVLLLESHPHVGDSTAVLLEEAGHRVLRCHGVGAPGFPCVGLTDPSGCPVHGGVDVAVDVRRKDASETTALEDGVSCALRAGVPVVEVGGHESAPLRSWTFPAGASPVAEAVEAVAAKRYVSLEAAIVDGIALLAAKNDVDPGAFACRITRHGRGLSVEVSGPPVAGGLQQAMAVRAYGIVRDTASVSPDEVAVGYVTVVEGRPGGTGE